MTHPKPENRPQHVESMRFWERTTPWYRRFSARLGLQGKLTIGFTFLLSVALGGSCWYLINDSQTGMTHVRRQEATAMARTLAASSRVPVSTSDVGQLNALASELLKDRAIIGAAFFDEDGRKLASASEDPDLVWSDIERPLRRKMHAAEKIHDRRTASLGQFIEVTVPIRAPSSSPENARPSGFVTICVSRTGTVADFGQVTEMFMLIGAAVSLVSFPLIYGLVHRIFLPIRELVDATGRIARGDLDTAVAVHRPDVIGDLARSFNEMVIQLRQQQQALEDANADLERKVEQRTAQLETANRRLRSEIAEKEDFVRAVSHDLNAPLRNISGMTSMLLLKHREQFDEDIVHRLERIQKNVEIENDLIGELLELSRISTHRHISEPVDMEKVVRDMGGMFENDLRTRQIAFIIDTPLPTISGEPMRLRQVFQNLIDNAIKYMGDGKQNEIHVGCAVRTAEVEFYVRDTGVGIEPDEAERIFQVFRRGKVAAESGIAGKGVGLASVKKIIETYNGTIWVESRPGAGSTFRFTINGEFLIQPPLKRGKAA